MNENPKMSEPLMEDATDEGLSRREVIAHLWQARDFMVWSRWLSVLVAIGGFSTVWVTDDGKGPIVVAGVAAGALAVTAAALVRTRPEFVVPSVCSVPSLIVCGAGAMEAPQAWWAIALVIGGAVGASFSWRAMRSRMLRAQRLAARYPQLQASRAWRGEPAVRDPYRT